MTFNDWSPLCSLTHAGVHPDCRRHFAASCVGKPFVDGDGRHIGTVVGARVGDDGDTLVVHVEPLVGDDAATKE
jgi:hypothetical protein